MLIDALTRVQIFEIWTGLGAAAQHGHGSLAMVCRAVMPQACVATGSAAM